MPRQKSVYWMQKLSNLGNSKAIYWLSEFYMSGYGVAEKRAKGVFMIMDDVRNGNKQAL